MPKAEELGAQGTMQMWQPWEDKRLNQLPQVDLPISANKPLQLKPQDFPTLTSNLFLTETATIPSMLQIPFV